VRILLIAVQYPPSTETGAKRPWLLAKEFRKRGHDVDVLCQQERIATGTSSELVTEQGSFGERVIRVRPMNTPGLKDEAFRSFWSMRSTILSDQKLRDCAAAILTGPPFFHFLLVPLLNRLRVPAILDYRDGWAADPYPFRSVKDAIFRSLGKLVEPALFRRASAAVFISESLRGDHLYAIRSPDGKKAFVIPNGVDIEEFESARRRDLRAELGFPADVRLFLYAGSLTGDVGAESFVRNLNAILRKSPPVLRLARFVFIGPSTAYSQYFDGELLDSSIRFLPLVPLTEAYAAMKGADVLLSLGGNQAQRLNRKIFEYAAAARPILHVGSPNGETANVVRRRQLGVVVPPDDCQALETGLQALMADPELNRDMGSVGQSFPFSTEAGASSYLTVIESLATRG
jgi:glycosyltransferase involved in cell wall biosynthesis